MREGIRDHFSKGPEKKPLHNESIYMISQVDLNQPQDLALAAKYFAKPPQVVIRQQAVYADHLIRAANTVFAFFSEGQRTRAVLLSNVAMKSIYFTGGKGMVIRQYLLNGVTGGVLGTATGAYANAKDDLANLLSGATKDLSQKNACNRGLAQGLIRYSQSLFSEFVHFAQN